MSEPTQTSFMHRISDNNLPILNFLRLVMRPISVGMLPLRLLLSIGNVGEGEDNQYIKHDHMSEPTQTSFIHRISG